MTHLTTYMLCDEQHGFRSQRSCESQLISTVNDFVKAIDKSQQIDAITLDLSKLVFWPSTMIHPILEYYNTVWSPYMHTLNLISPNSNMFKGMQAARFVRVFNNFSRYSSPTSMLINYLSTGHLYRAHKNSCHTYFTFQNSYIIHRDHFIQITDFTQFHY